MTGEVTANTGTGAVLVWLREDLRLRDNPALTAATRSGLPVVPVFVEGWDDGSTWSPGSVSRWWRARSLQRFAARLAGLGLPLVVRRGAADRILDELCDECGAGIVFANRVSAPLGQQSERRVGAALAERGRRLELHDERYLVEWPRLDRGRPQPYAVFTPFWRACMRLGDPPRPTAAPKRLHQPATAPHGLDVDHLALATDHAWAQRIGQEWEPGEAGARTRLAQFIAVALDGYAHDRDRPDLQRTSELSPHLGSGEISVREVWWAARDAADRAQDAGVDDRPLPSATGPSDLISGVEAFQRQLVWRDFAAYILSAEPSLGERPLRREFESFPWADDDEAGFAAWKTGRTGYPLVDAGMRALWDTGWLHNRVRLVCASFLVKHLLVPWQRGERWFWETLVDADLANNAFGWQWVAGSGADAAPYFRILNPTPQGQRHDPDGRYVRRWLPELERLPAPWIHRPWQAPEEVLRAAGVTLGKTYPRPIVDHLEARRRALDAFRVLRDGERAHRARDGQYADQE